MVKKICEFCGRKFFTPPYRQEMARFCSRKCYNTDYESLKKLGVTPRKSWNEYGLPQIPNSLMWHFLRGAFDGDGSFYIDNRGKWKYLCASLSCGSYKFLQEINEWLEKYKIQTHKIRFDKKQNGKGCWQLRITKKGAIRKFSEYLYKNSNYFLNRKYKIVESFYAR